MHDNEATIRDKKAMRRRLLTTQMKGPEGVRIEEWTPGDISEIITYECALSLFGEILIGATSKGICYLGFTRGNRVETINDLTRRFPGNTIMEGSSPFHTTAIMQMNDPRTPIPVRLHLKGTAFQIGIWKKLAQIPLGGLTTYTQLGGGPKIARAIGAAVGSNPVGFLLPCHRVMYADGSFDRYFWGTDLKEKLLAWEAKNC